ncbi:hypothetical protein [Paraburkholderia dinghuensis]|uniref:Uncharacterized protein n=1 Tax=Paraburkholderia dinghuensis TaxID=2305225 RepID=A0A3N6N8S7_9BURK|nr:hypothetical protein [Paraburkholderia dinghuensis]RQH07321.1 hypothetical protein D1Y85_07965 [Paraburkholderia dinghuensis]
MSARDQHKTWKIRTVAMSLATIICAPCAAVAASGGQIFFAGMIVAPPYSIATASGTSSAAATTAGAGQSGPATATVTFAAEPASPPYAEVTLATMQLASTGNGSKAASPFVEKFADGNGHRLTPDQSGTYHLGASGGTLQIKAPDSSAQTPVIVVTSYD